MGQTSDCKIAIALAQGLGMNTTYSSTFAPNCCNGGYGITCFNTNIQTIDWSKSGLFGSITSLTWSGLVAIKTIILKGNTNITGQLPTLAGTLKTLNVQNTQIDGPLPVVTNLNVLDISNTLISGSLSINSPTILDISYTQISAVSITSTTKFVAPYTCDLSHAKVNPSSLSATLKQLCVYDLITTISTRFTTNMLTTTTYRGLQTTISTRGSITNPIKESTTQMSLWTSQESTHETVTSATTLSFLSNSSTDALNTTWSISQISQNTSEFLNLNTQDYSSIDEQPNYTIKTRPIIVHKTSTTTFPMITTKYTYISKSSELTAKWSTSITNSPNIDANASQSDVFSSIWIYLVVALLVFIIVGLLVAKRLVKAPVVVSQYGRRNTLGTLMSVKVPSKFNRRQTQATLGSQI
eukprot:NODE_70_length_24940_cov_0.663138.p7 type:complete len:411 gc:universal NODE_70_length_24940_cov_0.663138:14118-12886(-)